MFKGTSASGDETSFLDAVTLTQDANAHGHVGLGDRR